ncbi:MAG: S41 family peptidase [Spirochaetales bacterium]|nr:S41 family peptidase [Spirochaetales bacterium]
MPENNRPKRRERAFWVGLTSVLVGLVLLLAVAPSVFAQSFSDTDRVLGIFENIFRFVEENYVEDIDPDVLLEGALEGLFSSLDDPYSAYLDETDMRSLTDTTTGEYGGVGMLISKQRLDNGNGDTGYVEVISPIEDTPAHRVGVRAGDVILGIEDPETGEFLSTDEMSIDQAVDRLRGVPQTPVTINVRRGATAIFPITIVREIIEYPTVKFAMIAEEIGFLRISNFTPRTTERILDALEFFERNDYTSMIIDLRSNPGGLLDSVVEVADLFFSSGTIVGTSGRISTENERFVAQTGTAVPADLPVVALIDEGSASAAEILAGALQDRDRAILLGDTSYGKGSVQQIRRVGDGGFRLTMSKYYLPSGRFIDKIGVSPDEEVLPPELDDDQHQTYTELLSSPIVVDWVTENREPTDAQIGFFVIDLQEGDFDLPDRWVRRAVRNEINRQNNIVAPYDLDFDTVLQEAVRMLQHGEVTVR